MSFIFKNKSIDQKQLYKKSCFPLSCRWTRHLPSCSPACPPPTSTPRCTDPMTKHLHGHTQTQGPPQPFSHLIVNTCVNVFQKMKAMQVWECVSMHTHTHMHVHAHTRVHMHAHAHTHVHAHMRMHTHIHARTQKRQWRKIDMQTALRLY